MLVGLGLLAVKFAAVCGARILQRFGGSRNLVVLPCLRMLSVCRQSKRPVAEHE